MCAGYIEAILAADSVQVGHLRDMILGTRFLEALEREGIRGNAPVLDAFPLYVMRMEQKHRSRSFALIEMSNFLKLVALVFFLKTHNLPVPQKKTSPLWPSSHRFTTRFPIGSLYHRRSETSPTSRVCSARTLSTSP